MREMVKDRMIASKVAVVARGLPLGKMASLSDALFRGGMTLIEITFDQAHPDTWTDTAEAIRLINERFDGKMIAGAGTVLTCEQVRIAHAADAQYISSPNIDPDVIALTRALGMLSLPGALSPTEIVSAYDRGADLVKVFPAGTGGPDYIRAIRLPLAHIPLTVAGGVSLENAAAFIRVGAKMVGVGGNLVNREWIAGGEFDRITALAHQYVKAVKSI